MYRYYMYKYIHPSEFLDTRFSPGAGCSPATVYRPKNVVGLAFWSAHADSQGTALTGGWMDQG